MVMTLIVMVMMIYSNDDDGNEDGEVWYPLGNGVGEVVVFKQ